MQPRHEEISSAITNHLETAITSLEQFVAQVRGNDQAENKTPPALDMPLAEFMSSAASSINSRSDRINKAVGELREALL